MWFAELGLGCLTMEDPSQDVNLITCRELLSQVRVVKDCISPRIAATELSARIKQRAKVCHQCELAMSCVCVPLFNFNLT